MLITVKIRRLQGSDEDIQIDDECTILELKQFLHYRLGIDPAQQRLIFCGHVLDDTRTISDCNIADNQVVHMVSRPPPLPARSQLLTDVSESDNAPSQLAAGQSSLVFVTHEEQGSMSPTAIRLRILHTIVSELRTRLLELDSGSNVESTSQTVQDNPVDEFARLIAEVHRLDRIFETHRENYIGLINDFRDTNGPRDERSIQARMRYSEQINGVFHNLAHAFHLLSDIAMLESPHGTQLASEAFLRQGQTATLETHTGRTGNIDGNINEPFNVEIDPIMIQLQIETSEPTMSQTNATNAPPDIDMEDLNPDDMLTQEATYATPQEYLRSLQQRMLNIEQHVEQAAREFENLYHFDEALPCLPLPSMNPSIRVRREFQNPNYPEARPLHSGSIQPGLRSTAAALDFGMELDDSPLGNGNLQDFLGNPPNLAGIIQNAQSPMIGSVPSDLIQQILSSVIRNEVTGANWPNTDQNATEPGARPENVQQPRRPAADSPDDETRPISISNIVYDQATPCESRHTRRALHLRSGINPAEFPMQHNDAASTRSFFTVQSLYDRFERNPRSPDNLVTAYFLLLREAVVPTSFRYLSTHEVLQVGDVVVTYFRGLLQSVPYEESVDRVTDIIMSKHTQFLRRVPLMVFVSSSINMTASIRAVLCHHMPAIFNLISIRDPNEFCRSMRSLVPQFYQDMCIVLFHCVGECSVALETVFRAYLIDCIRTMDDTNRDLLLNIAFYCMSAGVYRASMSPDEPPHFIVPRDQQRERDTGWNASPQPSTSRATESHVNQTRDMYSGNLPRARPMWTSRAHTMRMRSATPLDANRPTWNSGSEMPQTETDSAMPPDTAAPVSTTTSASAPLEPVPTSAQASAPSASASTSAPNSAPSGPVFTFIPASAPSASVSTAAPDSAPSRPVSTSAPDSDSSGPDSTSAPDSDSSAPASTSASAFSPATAPSGPDSTSEPASAPSTSASGPSTSASGPSTSASTYAPYSASTSASMYAQYLASGGPSTSASVARSTSASGSSATFFRSSLASAPVSRSASTSASQEAASALPMSLVQFVPHNVPDDDTASYSLLNESNIDWWSLDEDRLIAMDTTRDAGRNSPLSDAYHCGHAQRSQDQSLPIDINSFAEYVVNDLGESLEVDDRMRSMFLAFISSSIEERTQQSPDYDRTRFLASRLLTDNTISPQDRKKYQDELLLRCQSLRSPDGQERT